MHKVTKKKKKYYKVVILTTEYLPTIRKIVHMNVEKVYTNDEILNICSAEGEVFTYIEGTEHYISTQSRKI